MKIENDDLVTLTKNRKYQTKIILQRGKRHYSPYYTDYGLVTMSVYTHSIENNLSESGGEINVKYTISVNAGVVNIMDITVKLEKIKNEKQEDLKNVFT